MQRVAPDVSYLQTLFVNVYFIGPPDAGDREWVLVDAGVPGSASLIAHAAASRFGQGARPAAILLTHGHFDHVGALRTLAGWWDVPIYAHPLELPFLDGRSSYPPADPSVGGGMMAWSSRLYPRGPFDVGQRVEPLPADGSVPGLPDWRWLHTPGHSPGHVSFLRSHDRVLIAGDAFVTTKQESMLAAFSQWPKVHGPPAYFTHDWVAARSSVQRLAGLDPTIAGTGHGIPMHGEELNRELRRLASEFWHVAAPSDGRYVRQPAVFGPEGTVYVPPSTGKVPADLLATLGLGVAGVALLFAVRAAHRERPAGWAQPHDYAREVPGRLEPEPSRPSLGPV